MEKLDCRKFWENRPYFTTNQTFPRNQNKHLKKGSWRRDLMDFSMMYFTLYLCVCTSKWPFQSFQQRMFIHTLMERVSNIKLYFEWPIQFDAFQEHEKARFLKAETGSENPENSSRAAQWESVMESRAARHFKGLIL